MNDLQMTRNGDLAISKFDILTTDSIEQAILIRLRWFFGEWIYNESIGIEWFEKVLVKNPNSLLIRRMLEDAILSVDGVLKVSDMKLTMNRKTRIARISFRVLTDQGATDMMELVPFGSSPDDIIAYVKGNRLIIKASSAACHVIGTKLYFTRYANVRKDGSKLILKGKEK